MSNLTKKEAHDSRRWYLFDATGKTLGRFASEVAKILRGKHRPDFTSYVDCGDGVVIINAEKIRLTGKKLTDKVYVRHTGFPGGQRFTTPKEMLKKRPIAVIEHAVKGMLPKNKLASAQYGNLYVYAGSEHPHEAQKPKVINLSSIK